MNIHVKLDNGTEMFLQKAEIIEMTAEDVTEVPEFIQKKLEGDGPVNVSVNENDPHPESYPETH